MVRLRDIPRTATFAWSPGAAFPLIATGTRAGAVDVNFSNETCLEIWDIGLNRGDTAGDLQPIAKFDTDSGFNDLAWAESDEHPRGVIAGALENGSLEIWDADKLINGASDALISKTSKHSGAIKSLQFNPRHSNLLATGGAKGEIFVFDLNNIENPERLGSLAARADDINCLDWNKKVPHILVTGSSAGFVTVWDVKSRRESLTLNNMGRKAVSAVAWDPERPTKLITSTPLESDPMILVWDLRNSHAPERTLRGHESGVLSLSWCAQDPDLLLSSGMDNRTICWNPQTGQAYGEFPVVTNWTFQTRWNPRNPNFFATASFDGKISVQTVQNTSTETAKAIADENQALDGEDFFAKAQSQPQVSNFSLPKAPRWLERPCGVSFGFGGRVVSIGLAEKGKRASKIKITPFEVDASVANDTEKFENALKDGDLRSICEARIASAVSEEEKADWKVIEALLSENPKKSLVDYLGFYDQADQAADGLAKLDLDKAPQEPKESEESKEPREPKDSEDSKEEKANGEPTKAQPPSTKTKKHKRLQSMFDTSAEADSFLSDISPSKGAKTNDPFQIVSGSETEAEKQITKTLLLGDFEKALDLALREDRLADAFMIAICGGQKCIEKAQEAYLSKQTGGPNYVRLLASIAGKNLWDIVHNADLSNWKEAMATICTFADENEFPDLCEALGDRIEEHIRLTDNKDARKDASFCYLAGRKLEKVVGIWVEELGESERKGIESATGDSIFSIHVHALQGLIEKVTIFRRVTNFEDSERSKESDWKLGALYDKYIEYADVVATHGRLQVAQKYLDLVPEKHSEAEVARNRIKFAMRQAAPQAQKPQTTAAPVAPVAPAAAPATNKPLPPQPSPYQPQPSAYQPQPNPYQPQPAFAARGPTPAMQNPYAPPTTASPYSIPPATTAPYTNPYAPPPPQMRPTEVASVVPPPPRASSTRPAPASTSATAGSVSAWNDLPEGFVKPPMGRRGTPGGAAPPISSPFQNQSPIGQGPPPPGPPPVGGQRTSSIPPPPKGAAPTPRMNSPSTSRQGSFAAPPPPVNPYAQIPQSPQMAPAVPIPRGPSPYTAPPQVPPPANRYAPSPAIQPASPSFQPRAPVPPPPQTVASPYAPHPAQPPVATYQPPGTPPTVHQRLPTPQISRPSTAQSQRQSIPPPAPSKYPPGDRSHIPANAAPIYEILSADMQRVKGRAPSSFRPQVEDADRRLNILFDHLNNDDLLKPNTMADMVELSRAIQMRDYETAKNIHLDIMMNRTDECGQWMVGVKRLISMSRATP